MKTRVKHAPSAGLKDLVKMQYIAANAGKKYKTVESTFNLVNMKEKLNIYKSY